MQEKSNKIILFAVLAVAIIASVFAVLFAANGKGGMFDVASVIVYCLVGIAIVAALATFVKLLWTNKKSFFKTLIVAAILCVIFAIAWILSSGTDVSATMLEKFDITESGSKLVGAACISVYILFFASILSIVYVEVAKLIKK